VGDADGLGVTEGDGVADGLAGWLGSGVCDGLGLEVVGAGLE